MNRELHYPGDVVADTAGRVMGPTLLGQLLCVYHAEYDPALNTTTAHLRAATLPEVEAAA